MSRIVAAEHLDQAAARGHAVAAKPSVPGLIGLVAFFKKDFVPILLVYQQAKPRKGNAFLNLGIPNHRPVILFNILVCIQQIARQLTVLGLMIDEDIHRIFGNAPAVGHAHGIQDRAVNRGLQPHPGIIFRNHGQRLVHALKTFDISPHPLGAKIVKIFYLFKIQHPDSLSYFFLI